MLVVFFATLAGTVWLFVVTPKGLFPQEDIGQLSVSTEARQDISFEAMVGAAAAGGRRLTKGRRMSPTWPPSSGGNRAQHRQACSSS